jgi:hypothetical protein
MKVCIEHIFAAYVPVLWCVSYSVAPPSTSADAVTAAPVIVKLRSKIEKRKAENEANETLVKRVTRSSASAN